MAGAKIDIDEVIEAVKAEGYPALLTIEQAAQIAQLSLPTLYRYVSEGVLRSCVKRGKPLRFVRDAFLREFLMCRHRK